MTAAAGAALTVMLVDEHRMFRDGLCSLLVQRGYEIAGEAADASQAVAIASAKRPNIALMDVNLPDRSGVETIRALRLVSPATRVVMLTASSEERDVVEAIDAGACGYLLKDCSAEEIALGVRAAAAGEALLSPRIAANLVRRLRDDSSQPQAAADGQVGELTPRELEVLKLLAAGLGNREIAAELTISEHTVKSHVSRLLSKLRVENRIQAAVRAVRERLL